MAEAQADHVHAAADLAQQAEAQADLLQAAPPQHVAQAGADLGVARQQGAVDVEAVRVQALGQRTQLGRGAGGAVDQQHGIARVGTGQDQGALLGRHALALLELGLQLLVRAQQDGAGARRIGAGLARLLQLPGRQGQGARARRALAGVAALPGLHGHRPLLG
jgi:hypothetical protein